MKSLAPGVSPIGGRKLRAPQGGKKWGVLAGLILGASVHAATFFQAPINLESPNTQSDGYFGAEGLSGVPDVNGDGVPEFAIPALCDSPNGSPSCAGRMYLYDGATRELLRELKSPNERVDGGFGWNIAGIEDLIGNGPGEVVVGADGEERVYVMDGSDGALIHTLNIFARVLSPVPDVNEDGVPEIAVGTRGQARLFDGMTGALLRSLGPVGGNTSLYGWSMSGMPDVNDNATGDVIVSDWMYSGSEGRAYVFDGGTGDLLHTLSAPMPRAGDEFGRSVVGLADVNGDGRGDFTVGASGNYRGNFIFDGATGTVPPFSGSC